MSGPQSLPAKQSPSIKPWLIYLGRTCLLIAALSAYAIFPIKAKYQINDSLSLFDIVAQLDLFRALFYSLVPAAAAMIFMPRIFRGESRGPAVKVWLIAAALFLSAALSLLPLYAISRARPGIDIGGGVILSALFLFINLFTFLYFHCFGLGSDRFARTAIRAVAAFDLIVPLVVWAAYRKREGPWFALLRPLPALWICLVAFVPWFFDPHALSDKIVYSPALKRLSTLPCYQVMVHPEDGSLIVASDDKEVYRLDADDGRGLARVTTEMDMVQALGLSASQEELFYSDPNLGKSIVLDASTLEIEAQADIADPIDTDRNKWRTLVHPEGDYIITYSMNWIAKLDAAGDRILALFPTDRTLVIAQLRQCGISDVRLDLEHDRLLVTIWDMGKLLALDLDKLEPLQTLETPIYPERMAHDPQTGRLFVTLPLLGQLMVIDLDSYEETRRVYTFPGVRVIALDTQNRRIYLGGFSPVIEIRSLDDFSIIDRITAPAWMRWMAVDTQRQRLYLTSGGYGLWRVDLDMLGSGSAGVWARRNDPFYPLLCRTGRLLELLLGWDLS